MTNEIEKHEGEIERAFNGKRAKSTNDEIFRALAPIFVEWPNIEFTEERLNLWYLMLRDIAPDDLTTGVVRAVSTCKFMPTVADIREQLPEKREPGPKSESENNYILPPPPPGGYKMFRLGAEEDKRQRMELLRMTSKWDSKYAR